MAAIMLILIIALLFPTAMMITDSSVTNAFVIDEGETQQINGNLKVSLAETNPNEANATVTVTDTNTLESITKTIVQNNTEIFALQEGDVNVTAITVQSGFSELNVEQPRLFGWNDNVKRILQYLPLFFASLAVLMLAGFLAKVIS